MKQIANKAFLSILGIFLTMIAWAQDDKKLDVDIDVGKDKSDWYTQPWVWIVGGAVFILLLVALMRGNKSKE